MLNPLPYSSTLAKFCETFEAVPGHSDKKFYRRTMVNWSEYNVDPLVDYKTETVDAVAIHIPIHRLDEFVSAISERQYDEMTIRSKVPAVKKAYDQYQLLLKMCGGDLARY